ncbi:MAG TPA: 1,4-dihydroxy-6-naphthoate synthase [Bacteroidetes bacterium]|nr:1,4-dihydroxy-6-naphthoate synthase [Bacteroidota bacterium]
MRTLSLGISTCPNDTFIFDAMINGKVDTRGLEFNCMLTDVEELNNNAFEGKTDITKISYHAYAGVADSYILLNSGSALGFNNGPLLVAAAKTRPSSLKGKKIAIPGKYTTANLLLSIAYPDLNEKYEALFSDIEDLILRGDVAAGLLIHENRFTYEDKGLHKLVDLGEEWQRQTGMPIPLGGIAIRRELGKEIAEKVDKILASSIDYAFNNPGSSYDFVSKYAASMDRDVIQKHIKLYVNEFSRDLGARGREAVRTLYNMAADLKIIHAVREDIFTGH